MANSTADLAKVPQRLNEDPFRDHKEGPHANPVFLAFDIGLGSSHPYESIIDARPPCLTSFHEG